MEFVVERGSFGLRGSERLVVHAFWDDCTGVELVVAPEIRRQRPLESIVDEPTYHSWVPGGP